MAALTLTAAVIEAFAAIDAVPDGERIMSGALLGEYATGDGYYWAFDTRREYSNHPSTPGTSSDYDKRNAKTEVLASFAKLVSSIPTDAEPESPDNAEEGG